MVKDFRTLEGRRLSMLVKREDDGSGCAIIIFGIVWVIVFAIIVITRC